MLLALNFHSIENVLNFCGGCKECPWHHDNKTAIVRGC